MGQLRKSKFIGSVMAVVSALCVGLFSVAGAQVPECEYMSERTDERYSATVSTCGHLAADTNVSDVSLRLEWWGLAGQPVYQYALKWLPVTDSGGQPFLSIIHDGKPITLRRADLSDYPDLEMRFDRIKPTDISVKLPLEIYEAGSSMQKYTGRSGVTRLSRTPHLTIGRANVWEANMTPASPTNTEDFIQMDRQSGSTLCVMNKCKTGVNSGGVSETLNASGAIRFGPLNLESIRWPRADIASIYSEYQRREAKKEEDSEEDGGADLWDDDLRKKTDAEGESEDLWDRSSAPAEVASESYDSMWGDDPRGTATGGAMWNKPGGMSTAGKIVKDDRGQGVVGANGKILIPFRDWEILRYSEGVAKVEQTVNGEDHCGWGYIIKSTKAEKGLIDTDGDWLISPEMAVSLKLFHTRRPSNPRRRICSRVKPGSGRARTNEERARCQRLEDDDYERRLSIYERDRRKKRDGQRNCERELADLKSRYRSQGYKVN